MDTKEVFHCFAHEGDNDSLDTLSNPSTPLGSGTSSAGTTSDQDMDRSIFSMSMDSGIGSPASYGFQPGPRNVRSLKSCDNKKMPVKGKSTSSTMEHSSKEKRRRERIKGSCHQLRVLLPYIRGRKTDMASILEMCVDYLRIVNMCMPQSLQEQIVDLLSKDPTLVVNKDSIKLGANKENSSAAIKGLLSPSALPSEIVTVHDKTDMTSPVQNIHKDPNLSEMSDSFDVVDKKHIRLMPVDTNDKLSLDTHLDARLDPTLAGHTDIAPRYGNSMYSKSFSSEKSYAREYPASACTGGYNAAQQIYGTYSSNKSSVLESSMYRPSYGSTEGTFYQYYPSLVTNMSSTTRLYNTTDYTGTNPVPSSSLAYPGILSRHDTDIEHHTDDLALV